MPTDTSRLDELLGSIADYVGDAAENPQKARDLALRMLENEATKPVAEVLLRRGLGKRTAVEAEKIEALEAQLTQLKAKYTDETTTLKDELEAAKVEANDLRSKEPNWQKRIEETEKRWQKKLDDAQTETAAERRRRLNDQIEIQKQIFIGALGLDREGGVEGEWGRDVLPAKYADRFVPSEDGQTVRVLEIGEKASYYDPSDGEPAVQLARDALAKVPPKYRIMGTPEAAGGVAAGTGLDKGTAAVVETKARTGAYQL
jgi:hypothetical protein